MRICLATTHFAPIPGGISHYYTCLSRLLTDAGHTVILLTVTTDHEQTEDRITEEGSFIKIVLAKSYHHYLHHYSAYFRPGSYTAGKWIATGLAMRDWLLKNTAHYQLDLIETMDYGGAGIFLKYPGLPPLIIDAHSSAIQIDREYSMNPDDHLAVIKKLETLSFTYADAIMAHSPMNQKEIKSMGFSQVTFSRAPWLLPKEIHPNRQPGKNKFLVIGSLQTIKGAEFMIRTAANAGKVVEDLCIYWAGEDSYSSPGGKQTSVFLREQYPDTWGRQFVWLGQKSKDDIARLVSETSAVIIPSLWDTFNYVVPETIANDTPLIVSDKTGAVYLAKDNPLVTVFPAGDADALASLLVQAGTVIKEMSHGYKSSHDLYDYFSPDNILKDRMPVYDQVLQHTGDTGKKAAGEVNELLENYTTAWRKYYYRIRKKIKTLIRRDFNNLNH